MITCKEDLKGRYAYRGDASVFELFMKKCEELGIKWVDGKSPRQNTHHECVVFCGAAGNALTGAPKGYFDSSYQILTMSDFKPQKPTRTEYVKVTESIFDLKEDFEKGELFTKKFNQEWHQIKTEVQLGGLLSMNDDPTKNGIYRRIEKEVDWRDVTSKWVQKNQSVNIEFLTNAVMYYHGSVSNDTFLEMCRVALRATGELPTA